VGGPTVDLRPGVAGVSIHVSGAPTNQGAQRGGRGGRGGRPEPRHERVGFPPRPPRWALLFLGHQPQPAGRRGRGTIGWN